MAQDLTYRWVQDRMRDLHAGTLSAEDQHRLEEIALRDPFVADALEGYQAHPDIRHEEHLTSIANRIHQTKRQRRRWLIPNLSITAIAASIMIIIAGYAVVTRIQKEQTIPFVMITTDSMRTDVHAESDQAVSNDSALALTDITSAHSTPTDMQPASESTPGLSRTKPDIWAQSANEKNEAESRLPTPPKSTKSAAEFLAIEDSPQDISASSPIPPLSQETLSVNRHSDTAVRRNEGYFANQMNPDLMARRVTGQVIDGATRAPLIFAKIQCSYTHQPVYTDMEGYFELFLPERDAVLHVSHTGYIVHELVVRQGDGPLAVGLQTGVTIPPNSVPDIRPSSSENAGIHPAILAYENFSKHIVSNARFPLSDTRHPGTRKVMVEFQVDRNGRPDIFKITQSSNEKAYDDEAIRLIQTGPEWVCPDGQYPCQRSYYFFFQ